MAGRARALAATAFFALAMGISRLRRLAWKQQIPVETAEDARTA